jgi:hypothetical protein
LEVRLGGIYALERIAHDSPRDHWTILEVLTAYVRQNVPYRPDEGSQVAMVRMQTQKPHLRADIQAVLTVLSRRTLPDQNPEQGKLDLTESDLGGAYLESANLERALLRKTNLRCAYLKQANLRRADLRGANLEEADLTRADLQHASLDEANLQRVVFGAANLQSASFWNANLQEADLIDANVRGAHLRSAHTKGTRLPPHLIHLEESGEETSEDSSQKKVQP